MKTILAISLLSIVSAGVNAQNEKFYLGLGATYNMVKNVTVINPIDQMGFYVSASETGKLTDYFGYAGSAIFTNQRIAISNIETHVNNVGGAILFNYYPTKNGFKVSAGFNIGLILSAKQGGQDIPEYSKGYLSFNYGIGYEFEKFEIIARNNGIISTSVFDSSITLGIGYKVF